MQFSLLVLLIVVIRSFPVSTVQQQSTPSNHQAFSWDLNESYKQSGILSKNPEKEEEEYTSAYNDPNSTIWGNKRKRNTETRPKKDFQQQNELSTIIPKKRKTLITKARLINKNEQDKLIKMVNTKKGREKGKFYHARGKNTCNPHTPSCKHWDDLDDVQKKRERRKMRYYSLVSSKKRIRIVYIKKPFFFFLFIFFRNLMKEKEPENHKELYTIIFRQVRRLQEIEDNMKVERSF